MTREEFKSLVDGIKEKLDETSGALLAEDLIAILSAFNAKTEEVEKLAEEACIPLISMDASEDFDMVFNNLKLLNEEYLKDFANSRHFDWSGIDKILNS